MLLLLVVYPLPGIILVTSEKFISVATKAQPTRAQSFANVIENGCNALERLDKLWKGVKGFHSALITLLKESL